MSDIVEYELGKERIDPLQALQVGDWCWVQTMHHEWDDFDEARVEEA